MYCTFQYDTHLKSQGQANKMSHSHRKNITPYRIIILPKKNRNQASFHYQNKCAIGSFNLSTVASETT